MDSDNSVDFDQEFWELIEEEFIDDSDEEQLLENERQSGSSSMPKRRTMVDRSREEGHNRLFNDYFSENPVYTDVQFRRRFRMHRHVFLRIVDALGNHDEYFQMRVDATGKMGLSPLQKCTSAIRMLVYGSLADVVDEYVRIGESTSIECLQRFVQGVNAVFGAEYLRKPNNTDVEHLLQMGESRGFPGMLGSIDCMHWEWKNCPVAWKGQFVEVIMESPQSCLKQWHHRTYGFDMLFLVLLVQTMTLMC
ncbi:unnamed protein product [Vicia faba]|uniref:Nuclease HARBI1 n=1 Tax=Vicia faba TaxID=3906 RepID=A0AAV0ZGF2_VICFA|nr:unnamed protein product [Vicia faba]